ncbi:MAG TPA: hypothetical protein VKB93_09310 [Thermoanaerobaculia bacterium]|nr:hypothetical protein [Thermoanaerobaculia bacterium]
MRFAIAFLLLVACASAVFPQPPSPPQPCFFNVLKNASFDNGVNIVPNSAGSIPPSSVANWTTAFGNPQIVAAGGCPAPDFIAMWGNQVVGEALRQTLAVPLTAGKKYRFSACVRYANPSPAGPVRFKIRASAGPLPTYTAPGQVIGVTGNISSQNWANINLPDWTAPVGGLNTITINPENQFAVNDGTKVSWGHIDNVCLKPVLTACVLDPGMVNASNTFARRATLAQTFTPPNSGSLEKITHGLQHLSSSVNSYQLLITTTTNGLPSWTGGSTAVSGTVLYSATYGANTSDWATNGIVNAVVQIPWTNPVWLNAGTRYALVLIPGAPSNGVMYWRGNSGASTYPNGSAYQLNGSTWVVPATGPKDHGFRLSGSCH